MGTVAAPQPPPVGATTLPLECESCVGRKSSAIPARAWLSSAATCFAGWWLFRDPEIAEAAPGWLSSGLVLLGDVWYDESEVARSFASLTSERVRSGEVRR